MLKTAHAAIAAAILYCLAVLLGAFPARAEDRVVGQVYYLQGIDCGDKADVPKALALLFANTKAQIPELLAEIKAEKLSCAWSAAPMTWLGPSGDRFDMAGKVFDIMTFKLQSGELRYSWKVVGSAGA